MFLRHARPSIEGAAVIDALQNGRDRRILAATQGSPVDAQEIIEITGIPKSTVYRRLQKLEEDGLIGVEGGGMREGHAVDRYEAAIEMGALAIIDGRIEARWRVRGADGDGWSRATMELG